MSNPHISDRQRRARLVARHHLAATATDVTQVTSDLVAVHSSDPVTPVLAMWARIPDFAAKDLEDALYEQRTLWRLHAMRRTLWVVPADEATTFDAAVGRKVAVAERKRLVGWLEAIMPPEEVEGWLASARDEVFAALARGQGRTTTDLTDEVPILATKISIGKGKWAQQSPVSTRLLYVLAMELDLVRGRPKGSWRGSQFRWERARSWFGDSLDVLVRDEDDEAARARLANRYLARYGPVMRDDLKWFTGWTVPQTMDALLANGAVEVQLDRRETGWVLPDDTDDAKEPEEAGVVTLLGGLDPTPMGYKDRRFLLGPHGKETFDDTGNIGPTAWVDGRIVGGWAAMSNGEVVVEVLEDVGKPAATALAAEAARLTTWLQGAPVTSRFPSHLEKRLRGEGVED